MKKPRKPTRPSKPSTTYSHTIVGSADDLALSEIVDSIRAELESRGLTITDSDLLELTVITTHAEYDYHPDYYRTEYAITVEAEYTADQYKAELVKYEKKLEKYEKKLEKYEKKLEKYNEYTLEQKRKQLVKLKKELGE